MLRKERRNNLAKIKPQSGQENSVKRLLFERRKMDVYLFSWLVTKWTRLFGGELKKEKKNLRYPDKTTKRIEETVSHALSLEGETELERRFHESKCVFKTVYLIEVVLIIA